MAVASTKVSQNDQLIIKAAEIDQLEREKSRLVEQLKEVMKMNTHWQRYDSQREEYVLKLTKTNQELQDKISDLQRQIDELTNARRLEIQKAKPGLKEAAQLKEEERQRDTDEVTPRELSTRSPSSSLSTLRKEEEIAALTDHEAKLKDIILELEKGRDARKTKEDDELVFLREQINICVEDFNQERKDRERIHGENLRLIARLEQTEQQLVKNQEQMCGYQEQIKRLQERCHLRPKSVPHKPYDEPCSYPEGRPYRPEAAYQTRQKYRHPLYFGDDLTDLPGDVEIDGV